MIKPATLWNLFKNCPPNKLGRICAALGKQEVNPPLDENEKILFNLVVQDSDWMDERIDSKRELDKARAKKARERRKLEAECREAESETERGLGSETEETDKSRIYPSASVATMTPEDGDDEPVAPPAVNAPTWKEVLFGAKSLGVPEEYAKSWFQKMSSQDWCYMSRGQAKKCSRMGWKAVLRSFYDFDKKKTSGAAEAVPTVVNADEALRPTVGNHAITRDELNAYVAAVSPHLKYPLTPDDTQALWGFLASKQFRYKGAVITKDNCGDILAYKIEDLQKEKSEAPSEDRTALSYEPPTGPEVDEREYKKKMSFHRGLLANDEDKLRKAVLPQDRYCAEQLIIKRHCDMLISNHNYGKKIVEYEKSGRKWPCCEPEKLPKEWKMQPYITLYRGVWKRYEPNYDTFMPFGVECEPPKFT